MQCLKKAAEFEKQKHSFLADTYRNDAAWWFREAAKQTPWVKPIV